MESIVHRSNERGFANHGWLQARHSFSFAHWFDPNKIQFGALRVLNDDQIAPGAGFPTHPHDNMEIITIPLEGAVRHKDSMGNGGDIRTGELQVMSAGTGIQHSEFNASRTEFLKLFQIWIFPKVRNVEPRYDQFKIDMEKAANNFLQLVSPNPDDEGSWIHQDAWIYLADLDEGTELNYVLNNEKDGVYFMVIEGGVIIDAEDLMGRDAIGVWNTGTIPVTAKTKSKILVLEVPLKVD